MTDSVTIVSELETVWDLYEELAELDAYERTHPRHLDLLDNIYDCGTCGIKAQPCRAKWARRDALRADLGLRSRAS